MPKTANSVNLLLKQFFFYFLWNVRVCEFPRFYFNFEYNCYYFLFFYYTALIKNRFSSRVRLWKYFLYTKLSHLHGQSNVRVRSYFIIIAYLSGKMSMTRRFLPIWKHLLCRDLLTKPSAWSFRTFEIWHYFLFSNTSFVVEQSVRIVINSITITMLKTRGFRRGGEMDIFNVKDVYTRTTTNNKSLIYLCIIFEFQTWKFV